MHEKRAEALADEAGNWVPWIRRSHLTRAYRRGVVASKGPWSRDSAPCLVDLPSRGDQPDVAEGLREVAEQLTVRRVDLLSQKAQVIRVRGQLIEQLLRPIGLPGLGERGDQPERADDERAFLAGQPVGVEA